MTNAVQQAIKLFQFPRRFGIPNLSPFCCKLETRLRIVRVPYEITRRPILARGPIASCRSSRIPECALPIPRSSSTI